MKIALVCEQVDRRRGGAETSTAEMAQALAALGLDVTQVVSGAVRAVNINEGGVRVVECDVGRGTKFKQTKSFIEQADRFCRAERFDVIHAVTPCFACNVYQPRGGTYQETITRTVARAGGLWARTAKSIGRRFNRRQRFLLSIERAMLCDPSPPRVAAVSEYVRKQITAAFPRFPQDRLRVVFNGVDIRPQSDTRRAKSRATLRRELGLEPHQPLILFVAHNFKLKGLRELIRATALLPHGVEPAPTLVVVGRDKPESFMRLARRLGVEQRTHFAGAVNDLKEYYAAADLLAHPTWYDPCSRVVLEALGCGLPVVTTRFNGAAEVVEDGRGGVVIDSPRDVVDLAAALRRGLDEKLRDACRAAAGKLREQLSMKRHARELAAFYQAIVADEREFRR